MSPSQISKPESVKGRHHANSSYVSIDNGDILKFFYHYRYLNICPKPK